MQITCAANSSVCDVYRMTTGSTKLTYSTSSGGLFSACSYSCWIPGQPNPQGWPQQCKGDGDTVSAYHNDMAAALCTSCAAYSAWWQALSYAWTCGSPPPPSPPSCFSSDASVQVLLRAADSAVFTSPSCLRRRAPGATQITPINAPAECSSRMAVTSAWMSWLSATASSPWTPPRVSGHGTSCTCFAASLKLSTSTYTYVITPCTADAVTYQPIYFFGHHDPSAESAFVTIHTTITSVRMTRDHYIPVCSATDCSNQASFKNVPAGTVRSGQAVLVRTAGITNTPVCCDCEPVGCGFGNVKRAS